MLESIQFRKKKFMTYSHNYLWGMSSPENSYPGYEFSGELVPFRLGYEFSRVRVLQGTSSLATNIQDLPLDWSKDCKNCILYRVSLDHEDVDKSDCNQSVYKKEFSFTGNSYNMTVNLLQATHLLFA